MSAESQHHEAVFARDPHVCRWAELHRCGGRLTADHPIPKRTLKLNWRRAHSRQYTYRMPEAIRLLRVVELDDLIADPDNGLIVCMDANVNLAGGGLVIPRELLPGHVEHFAERWGLGWYLDDAYGRAKDAV